MYLIPATTHIITWQKQNLLDTATYYVQAVVRNVRSNTILATLNLTDLGSSNRFSVAWNVPPDPSNFGTEISIVKTVYEDAAYSVVSGMYGAWEDRYLIFNPNGSTSNTGGWSMKQPQQVIDYTVIAELVAQAVKKEMSKLPAPEKCEPVDLSSVTEGLASLSKRIDSMEEEDDTEEHECKVDLSPVMERISAVSKQTANISSAVGAVEDSVKALTNKVDSIDVEIPPVEIPEEVKQIMEAVREKLEEEPEENTEYAQRIRIDFGAVPSATPTKEPKERVSGGQEEGQEEAPDRHEINMARAKRLRAYE